MKSCSAYNTARMNDNSIRREASRLMTNPKVATTVAKLQQEADAAVVQERIASREEVLQTLTPATCIQASLVTV